MSVGLKLLFYFTGTVIFFPSAYNLPQLHQLSKMGTRSNPLLVKKYLITTVVLITKETVNLDNPASQFITAGLSPKHTNMGQAVYYQPHRVVFVGE